MKTIHSLIKCTLVVAFMLTTSIITSAKNTGDGYEVGDLVKDFSLKNIDGEMTSLSSFEDAKGFIVVFTCNTCPFSKMYEQRIEDLNKKYASKGYPVVAINSNDVSKKPGDSYDEMVKLAKQNSYSFPYLHDESQEIATMYGATKTPHVYVLKKENAALKVEYIGAIDNNAREAKAADTFYVESAVDNLIKGKEVSPNFTKAIGCTIKWKEA